jgi:hypothetical protein
MSGRRAPKSPCVALPVSGMGGTKTRKKPSDPGGPTLNEDQLRELFLKLGCIALDKRKPNRGGYYAIKRRINGDLTQELAHRKIYETFFGADLTDKVVRHKCDNPGCINPYHLIEGTQADNVRDRVERKRSAVGDDNGRSKLTREQAQRIMEDTTTRSSDLARAYGVSHKAIRLIRQGKNWRFLRPSER